MYRTWEAFKGLPKPGAEILSRPNEVQEVVRAFFQGVQKTLRPPDEWEIPDVLHADS
jgi:hypothetical protein